MLWHECMQASTRFSKKLKIRIFLDAVLGSLQPAYRKAGKTRKNKMVCSYRKLLEGVDEFEDRRLILQLPCLKWEAGKLSCVCGAEGTVKAQGVQLANLSCFPQ